MRHHVVPRIYFFSPDDSCPLPLKCIDVHREPVTFEKADKHIEEYWDGSEDCNKAWSGRWTGMTRSFKSSI